MDALQRGGMRRNLGVAPFFSFRAACRDRPKNGSAAGGDEGDKKIASVLRGRRDSNPEKENGAPFPVAPLSFYASRNSLLAFGLKSSCPFCGDDGTRTRNLRRDRATIQPIDLRPRRTDNQVFKPSAHKQRSPLRRDSLPAGRQGRRSDQLIYVPAERSQIVFNNPTALEPCFQSATRCRFLHHNRKRCKPFPPRLFTFHFSLPLMWALQDLNL